MKSYLNDIINIQSMVFDDFCVLIDQYGQDGNLYIKDIAANYVEDSNIIDYTWTEDDIIVRFESNEKEGEFDSYQLTDLDTEELIMLYESAYIFLMMTAYNVENIPAKAGERKYIPAVEKMLGQHIGQKAAIDMYESDDFFRACDDMMNRMELYGDYCINMDHLNELEDMADGYMDNADYEDDIDNDNDMDDNDYDDIDEEHEMVTFKVVRNSEGLVCIACYSEDNEDMPHMEIPVRYLHPYESLYYYDLIVQNESK